MHENASLHPLIFITLKKSFYGQIRDFLADGSIVIYIEVLLP